MGGGNGKVRGRFLRMFRGGVERSFHGLVTAPEPSQNIAEQHQRRKHIRDQVQGLPDGTFGFLQLPGAGQPASQVEPEPLVVQVVANLVPEQRHSFLVPARLCIGGVPDGYQIRVEDVAHRMLRERRYSARSL